MSTAPAFESFPRDGLAVVCGATGGIGQAFAGAEVENAEVLGLLRDALG